MQFGLHKLRMIFGLCFICLNEFMQPNFKQTQISEVTKSNISNIFGNQWSIVFDINGLLCSLCSPDSKGFCFAKFAAHINDPPYLKKRKNLSYTAEKLSPLT